MVPSRRLEVVREEAEPLYLKKLKQVKVESRSAPPESPAQCKMPCVSSQCGQPKIHLLRRKDVRCAIDNEEQEGWRAQKVSSFGGLLEMLRKRPFVLML